MRNSTPSSGPTTERVRALRLEKKKRLEFLRTSGWDSRPLDQQITHCIHWIRSSCIIQDPSSPTGECPFDLYDYQEQQVATLLTEVDKARHGDPNAGVHTDKTRQMGDTWLHMAVQLYALKFWSSFRALTISRKQQIVDDGGENSTPDSLFGKIRFMWTRLPPEQKFPLQIKHLRIFAPLLGGTLVGEAAGKDAGAGGTYLFGLWDETARTDHDWAILAAWQQAVRCPWYLSTPKGNVNVFAWIKKNAPIQKVRHHWVQHPIKSRDLYVCPGGVIHPRRFEKCKGGEKRSPWYDHQCALLPPEILAQEVDINYEASLPGQAFPEFEPTVHARPGLLPEPSALWYLSIDPGVTMAAAVLLQVVRLPEQQMVSVRVIDAWEAANARASRYYDLIQTWAAEHGFDPKKINLTGDPAGFNRDLTDAKSVFGVMRDRYGLAFVTPTWLSNVKDRVRLTRDCMAGALLKTDRYHDVTGEFTYRADLSLFAERLQAACWPTNQDGRVTSETDLAHNEAEHIADALTYAIAFALGRSTVGLKTEAKHRPHTAGLLRQDF